MNGPDYYLLALSQEEKQFKNIELADFVRIIFIGIANGKLEFQCASHASFNADDLYAVSHLVLGAVTWGAEA